MRWIECRGLGVSTIPHNRRGREGRLGRADPVLVMETQKLFPTFFCGSVQDSSLACAQQYFTLFTAEIV